MSLDTYLSIIIGDVCFFILSLLTNRNEHNGSKLHHKKEFIYPLIICLLVAVFVTALFLCLKSFEKKNTYKHTLDQGFSFINSMNYLEAANIFQQASYEAYDRYSVVESTYWQGTSYMLYAFNTGDYSLYNKAASCFLNILESNTPNSTAYYVDTMANFCMVLNGLNYDLDDPNYSNVIAWLEENVDLSLSNNLDPIENTRKLSVSLILGDYYFQKSLLIMAREGREDTAMKSATYYLNAIDLYLANPNNNDIRNGVNIDYMSFINAIEAFISASIGANDPSFYLDNALKLAEEMMPNLPESKDKLSMYLHLGKCIGEIYYFYGYIYKDEISYQKAYDVLRKMLNVTTDDKYIDIKRRICYYFVFTGLCTESEIEVVFDVFQQAQEQININNTNDRIMLLLSQCEVCKNVLQNYQYKSKAYDLGIETVQILAGYYNMMDNTQKETFESFSAFLFEWYNTRLSSDRLL